MDYEEDGWDLQLFNLGPVVRPLPRKLVLTSQDLNMREKDEISTYENKWIRRNPVEEGPTL